jgi:septal ring-binding cell division protein DamX
MTPAEVAEHEILEARPPEQTAIPPANPPPEEVAAESGELPAASTEEPIAGDGGNRPPEPAILPEDRQRVESLLAEAQEVVDAAGLPQSEESANPDLTAGRTGDSPETIAPAPPVFRPIKVKKVVITNLQATPPESRHGGSGSPASLSVEEGGKLPRLRSEEGKKKIQPESAVPAAASAVEQTPAVRIPQHPGGDGGLNGKQADNRQAGISDSPGKIAAVQSESKKIPVLGQAIVPQKASAAKNTVNTTVDHPGYPSRVDADPSWLTGARDNKYTVQLMALSSAAAVGNVNQMLTGNAAGEPAGTFYVFEKSGTTPEVFVFYGEYDSAAEAGKARDSLPEPLRKHKPYVLSVKSAMQKVK